MTALRQRMLEDMKIRNLALNTQDSYLRQVSQFARHFGKSPDLLAQEEIRSYQIYLTQEKKLAPGSVTIAVSALRFLYKVTLRREWNLDEVIPAPKTPKKLPVILSPEEVLEFLGCVRLNHHRTILTCCYAAGLRISEAIALQAAHIDSQRMVIRVEQGKGRKDRYVMLSPKLLEILRQWWRQERPQHWLFPGENPEKHITRGAVERACQETLQRCRIAKPVTAHTMRKASSYYPTFQSPFILKTIGLGPVQSAAVYGRSGRLAPEPAQLAIVDPFDR